MSSRASSDRPRPGVAASAWLSFTVETPTGLASGPGTTPGEATAVRIERGLRVQSVPAPGETAQVFETVEPLEAYPEWNAMRPRLIRPGILSPDLESVVVAGPAGLPRRGDTLLLVFDAPDGEPVKVVRRVARIAGDDTSGSARIFLADPPLPAGGTPSPPSILPLVPLVPILQGRFFTGPARLTDAFVGTTFGPGIVWRQDLVAALSRHHRWRRGHLERRLASPPLPVPPEDLGLFAFRARAALFGHNAPHKDFLGPDQRAAALTEGRTLADEQKDDGRHHLWLDRGYPGIVPGGYVVLESPAAREIYQVLENVEVTRADFGLTAKITRLALDRREGFERLTLRDTTVHAESEALELAPVPIEDPVGGGSLLLDRAYLGLGPGRTVVIAGELADLNGVRSAEVVRIAEALLEDGHTRLRFETALTERYVRASVTVNANVALATHGEIRTEVLGGGEGGRGYQSFKLRQPPLTYVTAGTASGALSTLRLYVNERLWEEVSSLYGHGPGERI